MTVDERTTVIAITIRIFPEKFCSLIFKRNIVFTKKYEHEVCLNYDEIFNERCLSLVLSFFSVLSEHEFTLANR